MNIKSIYEIEKNFYLNSPTQWNLWIIIGRVASNSAISGHLLWITRTLVIGVIHLWISKWARWQLIALNGTLLNKIWYISHFNVVFILHYQIVIQYILFTVNFLILTIVYNVIRENQEITFYLVVSSSSVSIIIDLLVAPPCPPWDRPGRDNLFCFRSSEEETSNDRLPGLKV